VPLLFNALRTVLFAFHASYIASQLYSAKSRVVLPSAVFIRSVLDTRQNITFSRIADRNFPYSFF